KDPDAQRAVASSEEGRDEPVEERAACATSLVGLGDVEGVDLGVAGIVLRAVGAAGSEAGDRAPDEGYLVDRAGIGHPTPVASLLVPPAFRGTSSARCRRGFLRSAADRPRSRA